MSGWDDRRLPRTKHIKPYKSGPETGVGTLERTLESNISLSHSWKPNRHGWGFKATTYGHGGWNVWRRHGNSEREPGTRPAMQGSAGGRVAGTRFLVD